jgi:hypothetical protein
LSAGLIELFEEGMDLLDSSSWVDFDKENVESVGGKCGK